MSEEGGGDRAPRTPAGSLARPPSDRYRSPVDGIDAEPARRSPWLVAIVVALAGAAIVTALGLIDLSLGLIAVAIGVGWGIGIAARSGRVRPEPAVGVGSRRDHPRDPARNGRTALAATLAVGSILVGLFGIWIWSRLEGGVLAPFDYFADRFDLLAIALPIVAGLAAAVRAR